MPEEAESILVHGTCIAMRDAAVLLRGAPGAGKSDLALRFLSAYAEAGAALVADDQVSIRRSGGALLASPPDRLAGLIEVRGVGIVETRYRSEAPVTLLADLAASGAVERMPPLPRPTEKILGLALPVIRIAPFEASAPVKLRIALAGEI